LGSAICYQLAICFNQRAIWGAEKSGRRKVVVVSSSGHHFSPVVFDDIHYHIRPYDPWTAYGQSKTAMVLFAVEASVAGRRRAFSLTR
jgi:NAD(P)-dependent dehydrogenase (short-subunit alcohol dehydrogenase family)